MSTLSLPTSRGGLLAVGLMACFVLLLPLTEAVHIVPLLLILGSVFMRNQLTRFEGFNQFLAIALLLTVPAAIAAIGARDVEKTLIDAVRIGLYFYAGLVLLMLNREALSARLSDLLFYLILLISLAWSADAIIQYASGKNLLGFEYNNYRVTGVFHPKMRIGIVLAHLLPFSIEACRRWSAYRVGSLSWLLLIPILFVIIIGGSRSSWLVAVAAIFGYMLFFVWQGVVSRKAVLVGLVISTAAALAAYEWVPQFQQRMDRTAQIFDLSEDSLNAATSMRGEVWAAAWSLFKDDPINGIGQGAMASMTEEQQLASRGYPHAHFFGLDVLMYAGLIGFVAYMLAFAVLMQRWWQAARGGRCGDFALTFAAVLMAMPINTHWGIYSTLSSSIMCMLIIVSFLRTQESERSVVGAGA